MGKIKRKPNNRGIAILIAIFSLGVLMFLAMEVSYETNVEYVVASQKVNRLKAYYAAKAGVELSLLRILLYKKAVANFGDQLGDSRNMLDPIWNFPFAWPPTAFIDNDNVSRVTKENIKKVEKGSNMGASYITSISSEGGSIDINDLGSDIEALQKSTRAQIVQIFMQEIENNDDFADEYSGYDFEELVNNITDFVDEDKEAVAGGDETSPYQDLLSQYPSEFFPPNQPFKTIDELHMVAGMNDDFFELLKGRVTVYGIKGVNINYASADILKSLDRNIDDEVAKEIIQRRNDPERGGPFKDEDEFVGFLGIYINTGEFNEAGIPLIFDTVYNFRIKSTGEFARAVKEIEVVTFDIDNLTPRIADLLDEQDKEKEGNSNEDDNNNNDDNNKSDDNNQDQGQGGSKKSTPKKVIPKGRPRIVYWHET